MIENNFSNDNPVNNILKKATHKTISILSEINGNLMIGATCSLMQKVCL